MSCQSSVFSKAPFTCPSGWERLHRQFTKLVKSKRGKALKPVHSPSRQAGAEYRRQQACLLTESIVNNCCSASIRLLLVLKRGTALKPVHSPSRQAGAEYRRQQACLLTESIVSDCCSALIGLLLDYCPQATLSHCSRCSFRYITYYVSNPLVSVHI